MSRIKKGKEDEWRELGMELFEIREKLQNVLIKHQHLLPKRVLNYGFKAVYYLDQYRCKAETEMFKRGGPEDLKVFYPGNKERR